MIAYPGYVEEVKNVVKSKEPSKELEKIPAPVEPLPIRKYLIEYRGHEDSICLLSRYKPQLLKLFFFCTGILALGVWIEKQRESLLAYGIFGILTGAYVKYVSVQESETKPHELDTLRLED